MGRVAAPHGVRGAVKVQSQSADPASLLDHPQWWVRPYRTSGAWTLRRVISARLQATTLVAELEGITSRDAASALRGSEVGVPRESLPALAADEYYRSDLVGMTVVNRSGENLGQVIDFAESGAHPILRIAHPGGERLIPWVPQYVERIDVDARRIEVDWTADY